MAQTDSPDAARQEGVLIAQEMLAAVRPLVQGVQVSAPFGRYGVAAEVISSVLPPGQMGTAGQMGTFGQMGTATGVHQGLK
jgi:homocysteine S-methyltransferase